MEYDSVVTVVSRYYQASYFWHRWPNLSETLWNTVSGLVAFYISFYENVRIDNIIYPKARVELVLGFF
jgi:hypothetical protein